MLHTYRFLSKFIAIFRIKYSLTIPEYSFFDCQVSYFLRWLSFFLYIHLYSFINYSYISWEDHVIFLEMIMSFSWDDCHFLDMILSFSSEDYVSFLRRLCQFLEKIVIFFELLNPYIPWSVESIICLHVWILLDALMLYFLIYWCLLMPYSFS